MSAGAGHVKNPNAPANTANVATATTNIFYFLVLCG